jgi:hypothetical protein
MNNETTMPGLLTVPADLAPSRKPRSARASLYIIIFVLAALALGLALWLL